MEKFIHLFSKPPKNSLENKKSLISQQISTSLNFLKQYIENPTLEIQKLVENASKCKMDKSIRLIAWLVFLNILPYDNPQSWNQIISDFRSDFLNTKKTYFNETIIQFIKTNSQKGSDEYENLKKQLSKKDFELLSIIKVDIDRTFQDLPQFTEPETKIILINVLFIYCKNNLVLGYIQGMNEIVGVLFEVLYQKIPLNETFIKDNNSFLYYIIYGNSHFLEADLYAVYCSIMNKALFSFFSYSNKELCSNKLGKLSQEEKLLLTKEKIKASGDSEIKKRIYSLFYIELKDFDKSIYNSIAHIIEPDLFLLRWMLCLFTREYEMEKVIQVWDAIFAFEFCQFHYKEIRKNIEPIHMYFADFICLSMIHYLKKDIVNNKDTTMILFQLMHFPTKSNLEDIIDKAIEISNEHKCNIFKEKSIFDIFK